MRFIALFTLAILAGLICFQPVSAQQPASLQVSNTDISYDFGTYIAFQAQINVTFPSDSQVFLAFRADGDETTHTIPITLDAQGNTLQRYDLSAGTVRPFSTIRYYYLVKQPDGAELKSDDFHFQYEDNRFTWQTTSSDQITIHWYKGDQTFGQTASDVARRGIKKISDLLLVKQAKPIDIYIYNSSSDQAQAIELGGVTSVGGHASPDLHLGLVSIPEGPDQRLEMEQKIPHELAHILTYDLMGERYLQLPIWLREGIASQAELTPNPDYPLALSKASDQAALISIAGLCNTFPPERGRIFLAYAEAESFTRFLIDKFGQTGLLALTSAYGDGLDCGQGMQQALGQPLDQVESEWHSKVIGENPGLTAFVNLSPYLAVLVILLTVSLVSAFTVKRPHDDEE